MADTPAPIAVTVPDRRVHTLGDLDARIRTAQAMAPLGWNNDLVDLRRQYEGHVEPQMLAAAAVRFRATSHQMPRTPFNWAETVAAKGSSIYDEPPTRSIVNGAGAIVDEGKEAADFAALIDETRLSVVMPEVDQRRFLARSMVLGVRSDTIAALASGKPAPTVVDIHWPNEVMVIPHPAAPTSLHASLELFVCTASLPGSMSWLHWFHDVAYDLDGNTVAFGKWRAELITVRTKRTTTVLGSREERSIDVATMWDPYPLPTLPYVVMNAGIPAGFPFLDANRNLVPIFNTINTGIMSEVHTVDMNAAPILTHTSKQPQPSKMSIGPGVKVNLLEGETLESVTQSADLAGIRATNRSLQETLATTLQQPSDAFTADGGGEPSGIALKIKNIPASKARRKSKEITRPFEETELLPLLVEVHDHFRGTSIARAAAGGYRCTYVDPPEFETSTEKQTRMAEAADKGWISEARAATESGYYKTTDDAETEIAELTNARLARIGGVALDGIDTEGADKPDTMDAPTTTTTTTAKVPPVDVQAAALNGAQVTALLEVIAQVSAGIIPSEPAIALLVAAFPGVIDEVEARKIIGKIPVKPPAPPAPTVR